MSSLPGATTRFVEQRMSDVTYTILTYIVFAVKHNWVVHVFQCLKAVRCGYLDSANSSKDRDDALSALQIGNRTKIRKCLVFYFVNQNRMIYRKCSSIKFIFHLSIMCVKFWLKKMNPLLLLPDGSIIFSLCTWIWLRDWMSFGVSSFTYFNI